jgi:hypothetical protein
MSLRIRPFVGKIKLIRLDKTYLHYSAQINNNLKAINLGNQTNQNKSYLNVTEYAILGPGEPVAEFEKY